MKRYTKDLNFSQPQLARVRIRPGLLKLEHIIDVKSKEFKAAWEIYESSFPSDERRNLAQQSALLKNSAYKFLVAYEDGQIVGIIAAWDLDDFAFIEHFAIKEGIRGKGFGTQLLREYLNAARKPVVLETERPDNDIARRSINFYEKLGFKLNTHDYTQPSYSSAKKPVKLFLMTHPNKIAVEEFSRVREKIHKTVYGIQKPLI